MDMVNYVAGLIQEIRDDETAIALKRDLLDTAWAELLLEREGIIGVPQELSGAEVSRS